jgi:uncharacterized membrane protein YhaH (DUF805 family)
MEQYTQAYASGWKNYFNFSGRSNSLQCLTFWIFNIVVSMVLQFGVGLIVGSSWGLNLAGLFSLAIFVPSIAVFVRRLHDTNDSGFLAFLLLIPIVGLVVFVIYNYKEGTPGNNKYGPPPVV